MAKMKFNTYKGVLTIRGTGTNIVRWMQDNLRVYNAEFDIKSASEFRIENGVTFEPKDELCTITVYRKAHIKGTNRHYVKPGYYYIPETDKEFVVQLWLEAYDCTSVSFDAYCLGSENYNLIMELNLVNVVTYKESCSTMFKYGECWLNVFNG